MSDNGRPERLLEPERYELTTGPAYHGTLGTLGRRDVFKVLGAGILIVLMRHDAVAQPPSAGGRRDSSQQTGDIAAWLHIAADGTVTAYTGKVEVGQDIRTSLTQAIAEELRVPPASITLVMGDTALTPFDMGTFGSRTTPDMNRQLRQAAAAARETLLDLAAAQWQVERGALVAAQGTITHPPTQRLLRYGQVSQGQHLLKAIGAAPLAPATHWQVAGTSLPKVAGRAIVTGRHQYTPDVKRPGMLYGKVLRPAGFGASLATLDTRQTAQLPGVTVVREGEFVGVTAPSQEQAERALKALRATWKTTPQISHKELYASLRPQPAGAAPSGWRPPPAESSVHGHGNAPGADVHVAYIAHAPLEPRAAVAEWTDGTLTVWTGTQRPFGVRGELA